MALAIERRARGGAANAATASTRARFARKTCTSGTQSLTGAPHGARERDQNGARGRALRNHRRFGPYRCSALVAVLSCASATHKPPAEFPLLSPFTAPPLPTVHVWVLAQDYSNPRDLASSPCCFTMTAAHARQQSLLVHGIITTDTT